MRRNTRNCDALHNPAAFANAKIMSHLRQLALRNCEDKLAIARTAGLGFLLNCDNNLAIAIPSWFVFAMPDLAIARSEASNRFSYTSKIS